MQAQPDDCEARLPVAWRLRPSPLDLQTVPGQPEDDDDDDDDEGRRGGGDGNIEPDDDEGCDDDDDEDDDEDDDKDDDEEPWQVRAGARGLSASGRGAYSGSPAARRPRSRMTSRSGSRIGSIAR
jgi:hypothetical protein